MPKETVSAIHHDSRKIWLQSFEATRIQLIHPFQERGIIAHYVFLLLLEERTEYPKQRCQEPVELEGNCLRLCELSVLAFHKAVDPCCGQRGDEFVPITVLVNGSTTSCSFLFQAIKEAG